MGEDGVWGRATDAKRIEVRWDADAPLPSDETGAESSCRSEQNSRGK